MDDAPMLGLGRDDVSTIHDGTAVYTARAEIDALLDDLSWPACGGALLDPACGDGNILVAAIARLDVAADAVDAVASRVTGVEFHGPTAARACERVAETLAEMGWSALAAARAAAMVVEERDFLLTRTERRYPVICANPPYLRRTKLPAAYRSTFDAAVPACGRGDMMHAFIDHMADVLAPGGRIGMVTSDRWLLNSGAADLRERMGGEFRIEQARRLDAKSAFHRPKERRRGSPPRVHPVAVVLGPDGDRLTRDPYRIDAVQIPDGVPLSSIAEIRLAPWLGPDGIFTVPSGSGLPEEFLVPAVDPKDIDPRTDEVGPIRRWAIVTGDEEPHPSVMEHLRQELPRMPKRGRRKVPWLPPERFDRNLPLGEDAIMVPRLAPMLRAVTLPAGRLPTGHSLVLVSTKRTADMRRILTDPRVRAQADALALMVDDGYRSYTATLLRNLVIPNDLVDGSEAA